jgi:hypothetical protein
MSVKKVFPGWKRKWRLIMLVLIGFLPSLSQAEVDIFGYYENRFFLVHYRDYQWQDFSDKFKLGDYNRLRLNLKAKPSDRVTLNVAVDFFTFHGIMKAPLGIYGGEADPGSAGNTEKISLDRAYVDLYFKRFDISIGKQRVAMGVSYLWAPLDLFNRINIFEPKEEKPGANAVKVYFPLGKTSHLTGVFAPESDFASSKSALRAKIQLFGVDMAITWMHNGPLDMSVYGVDIRGENFIGWWLEGGVFVNSVEEYYKIVAGFDYTFPIGTGIYWLNEYFYDSSGQTDSAFYDYTLLAEGNRFTLGRSYYFSMLRYQASDFISLMISYIANWGDGSFMISPVFSYDLFQNVSLAAGFYFPLGSESGEFNSRNTDLFFVWLKINF